MSVGRNDPCPCGSGKKHKHCCAGKANRSKDSVWTSVLVALVLLGGLLIAGVAFTRSGDEGSAAPPPGKVWSEEHQHWHDAP